MYVYVYMYFDSVICFKCRMIGEGLMEFSCCLSIDGHILKDESCIPYKYYVSNHSTPFEYLHGAKSDATIVNRCLKVPKESFQIGGTVCIKKNATNL